MKLLVVAVGCALSTAAIAAPPAKKDCGELPGSTIAAEAWAVDGDTLALIADGQRVPNVRLWGIQAAELRGAGKVDTVSGTRVRVVLDDMLREAKRSVSCQPIVWDRYCRIVATCEAGGQDLSLSMLERGEVALYTHYAIAPTMLDRARRYADAEATARDKRTGRWREMLGE